MAKQQGILPINGTIDNLTFVKRKSGFGVQKKVAIDKKKIATDPAFARTRENGAEFGRAGLAGKLIRTALRSVLTHASDSDVTRRLTKAMMTVIKADKTSERGKRNVLDGELEFLQGFDFNINAPLSVTLHALYSAAIDRATGSLKIDIPGFVPSNMGSVPSGATHFRIVTAGFEIDFENKTYVTDVKASADIPWNETNTGAISLVSTVTAHSTYPLFLAMGLEFFQKVGGKLYPLTDKSFNALTLVKVSGL